jgi:Tfp pilus assembly protein PilX
MSVQPGIVGRLREERGIALIMALAVLTFFAMTGITLFYYTTSNTKSTSRHRADQQAYALAEAGLNNAVSRLSAVSDPTNPSAVPSTTETLATGTATYSGLLTQNAVHCVAWWPTPCVWTLTATGSVRNPVGGASTPVTRQVSQQVKIVYTRQTSSMWNYLYSDATTGCMNVNNNATISSPLYVRGNLCMANNSRVTGSPLQVEGTLTVGNGGSVGTSTTPIAVAKLKGGCTGGSPNPHPCTSADRVYASSITTTPDGLRKPPVDFATWYQEASPGPNHNCTSGSLPAGTAFDNGGGLNRSNPAFNLTPSTAYSCSTSSGQISWTPGNPGTLTVSGVIFFDGDIQLPISTYAVYTGQATIYAYGRILFNNNAWLCGIAGCTSSWNTTQNVLMLVSGATSGYGLDLTNNTVYQGAAYIVADYHLNNNATNWGPVVANQIYIDNNAGQTVPLQGWPAGSPTAVVRSLELVPAGYSG